jgi:MinD superfamily P-loop ATPase
VLLREMSAVRSEHGERAVMALTVSIASGKGGTGKTTVATNLALVWKRTQLLDCDVEEPNAHIFLKPHIEKTEIVSIPVPEIDKSSCTFCGTCAEVCAFNALAVLKNDVLVFSSLCHGCGACSILCPEHAIRETPRTIGVVESGRAGDVEFVHGRLNIGETMSPPVIRDVKKHVTADKTTIIDAPPGTSCPVIESVKGSDFCVLVTEPSPFGFNDLCLAVEMVKVLHIPMGVVINRADTGYDKIDEFCHKESIPVLMRIPFDRQIAGLYSRGIPLVAEKKEYREAFMTMYDSIERICHENKADRNYSHAVRP